MESCPEGKYINIDGTCVASCPENSVANEQKKCVCSVLVSADKTKCVSSCVSSILSVSERECLATCDGNDGVNNFILLDQNKCTTVCPENMETSSYNSVCLCKTGFYLDNDKKACKKLCSECN